MGVAADACDADAFAAQLIEPGDLRLGENALSHDVLDAADKSQVGRATDESIDDTDAAQKPDFDIAAENRRGSG